MPVIAALAAALTVMGVQTIYKPPGAVPPYDGGDVYLLAEAKDRLFGAYVRPEDMLPNGYKQVTIVTYFRVLEPVNGDITRAKSHEYLGLFVDCKARTARITGLATWDSNGLGIEVFGGTNEVHPIQPNTAPALAEELLCQGKGRKFNGLLLDAAWRWRMGGRP